MEIVIKIDDAEYNKICNYDGMNVTRMMNTIKNGTPLPKGHGRLVDVDKLDGRCGVRAIDCYGDCDKCDHYVVRVDDIRKANTIIEADKG